MQDIVFYAAANETLGIVRDYANARKMPAPVLTLGVSVCLRMRLFSASDTAEPYPLAEFDGITDWQWRMDSDFNRNTTSKLVADANGISVHSVTDTVNEETIVFTEFVIPISNMNTEELSAWLGNEPKRSGLIGELVGHDNEGNAVFVLQIDNFTVRNRVAGLGDPTAVDLEYVTVTMAGNMIQTAVSSSADTKQDKLTSANAGIGVLITESGTISTANIPQSVVTGLTESFAAKQDNLTAGYRMELVDGTTIGQKRHFQIETPSGSTVTLQAGHAYRINATAGQKTLNVEALNMNEFGLEGHLELFVANMGYIHTGPNVVLANAIEPDAVNNCTVRFHDGMAIIDVEDHVAGYIVVSATGTADGSLPYGISASTNEYIAFDATLNGTTIDLSGSTANGEKHVVGNGYTSTTLTGEVNCGTGIFTVANLSLSDVQINGGTMTLGDACVPSGSTVAVSGGGLAVEKVTGAGSESVIDLNGTSLAPANMTASGVFFEHGSSTQYGGVMDTSGTRVTAINASGCVFANNSCSSRGGAFRIQGGTASFTDCQFTSNHATGAGGGAIHLKGKLFLSNTTFENSTPYDIGYADGGQVHLLGGCSLDIINPGTANPATVTIAGSNSVNKITGTYCTITISSGATVDLAGNTNAAPIATGGGITLYGGPMTGGTKIIGSAGSAAQTREFEDVEIHGTSITKLGIIYGATVSIPDDKIYHVRYTTDSGTTSSSVTITGPTAYVLAEELSSPAGLTGVVNI